MVFNPFFFKILIRIVLIGLSTFGLSSIFLRPDLFFTQVILFGLIIGQIIELSYFVNKTNYELSRFLAGVKDGDFQLNFDRHERTKSFRVLYRSFADVIETLKELETEKAAQLQFLDKMIDQVKFGIVVFDKREFIKVINQSAVELADIPKVKNWKNLKSSSKEFIRMLLDLPESNNQLIETNIGNSSKTFSVSITPLILREEKLRIVSFQDIKSEIQQKEIEAWHKLIRILTHEIMNSVTPLISLTDTMKMILESEGGTPKESDQIDDESLKDIYESVITIKERGEGMLQFVQQYRKLTKIPTPELETVSSNKLIDHVIRLMQPILTKENIKLEVKAGSFELNVDFAQMEQVLINLVKNSIEALSNTENPRIIIETTQDSQSKYVSVMDNGPGIPKEKRERIFIPFYTTKKTGSGIGLSLSRQVMNLHGGLIILEDDEEQTTFKLVFPN